MGVTELPFDIVFSFSCKDGEHTCAGDGIVDCARELSSKSFVSAIGVNCFHPKYTKSLVHNIGQVLFDRSVSSLHLFVYPNNGDTWDLTTFRWLPSDDGINYQKEFGSYILGQVIEGLETNKPPFKVILGGCCKVRPQ